MTIVVTAAAGGLTDLVARGVGQQLSEMWGKPVVIENKGGAGHNIGAAAVAKAAPDGYTLMVSESGTFVSNPYLYAKGSLPYDAETDFAPISGLASYTQALVTHPSLPARNVARADRAGEEPAGLYQLRHRRHRQRAAYEHRAPGEHGGHQAGAGALPGRRAGSHRPLGRPRQIDVDQHDPLARARRAGRINMLGVGSLKRLTAGARGSDHRRNRTARL